jgi:hypothetical protein
MCFLACYYDSIKEYDLMKIYYLMAIEKGNRLAMSNLRCYYLQIEKDQKYLEKA